MSTPRLSTLLRTTLKSVLPSDLPFYRASILWRTVEVCCAEELNKARRYIRILPPLEIEIEIFTVYTPALGDRCVPKKFKNFVYIIRKAMFKFLSIFFFGGVL